MRVLRIAAIAAAMMLAGGLAEADWDHSHPEWDQWFADQMQPNGGSVSCCNKADGHVLEDEDVRVVDGDYEVRTASGWLRFPNRGLGQPGNTVLGPTGNPTGHWVAWYMGQTAYCLSEGTQA